MKKSDLYFAWGFLFVLSAALGFFPRPEGAMRVLLTGISLLFFLPPALLLYRGSPSDAALIRTLSLASLGLTLAVLVISIRTALSGDRLAAFLHGLLTVISAPMVCSGYWALSLFLWACLLMVSLKKAKKHS